MLLGSMWSKGPTEAKTWRQIRLCRGGLNTERKTAGERERRHLLVTHLKRRWNQFHGARILGVWTVCSCFPKQDINVKPRNTEYIFSFFPIKSGSLWIIFDSGFCFLILPTNLYRYFVFQVISYYYIRVYTFVFAVDPILLLWQPVWHSFSLCLPR